MYKIIFLLTTLFIQICCYSQTNQLKLNEVASLIFKNKNSKLTIAQKNEIALLSKFKLNKAKNKIIGYTAKYDALELFPLDLNNDGVEEIFIIGHSELSGPSGECWFFIADKTGHYKGGFNDEGKQSISWNASPLILTTKTNGWLEITMSVPGMEMPILSWTDKGYKITKRVDAMNSKLVMKEVSEVSLEYQKK